MKLELAIHPAIASQHYRMLCMQSRVASASPHGLVGLLYEELLRSLDVILTHNRQGKTTAGSTQLAKALSIIVALEGCLDFANRSGLSPVLYRIYRSAAQSLNEAAIQDDVVKIEEMREVISNIAYAWQALAAG